MVPTADWIELYELVTRYSRALDTRDYQMARSIWAPDPYMTFDLSTGGVKRAPHVFRTADHFAEASERMHAPLLATMHRNTNHSFDIQKDEASGNVYVDLFEVRLDRGAPETAHHMGWYDDRYVRIGGDWKIRERHFTAKWSESPQPILREWETTR